MLQSSPGMPHFLPLTLERGKRKKNRPTSPFLIDMFHIAEINLCLCDWIWDLLIANLGEHRSVDHGVFLNYHNLFML